MKSTLFFTLIALLLQAFIAYFVESSVSSKPYFYVVIGSASYFSLFLIFGMRFLLKSIKGRPQAFVYTFMGYSGIKMFSSAILIVVLGLVFRPLIIEIALCVLVQYFLYMAFEIVHLRAALLRIEKK